MALSSDSNMKQAQGDQPTEVKDNQSGSTNSVQRERNKKSTPRKPSFDDASGKAWTFPKLSLEESIRVAQAIEENNAGNPLPSGELVKAVGFKKTNDWRFRDLLKAAIQYGLVEGTPTTDISLTALGNKIVAPSDPGERTRGLASAFESVPDFKKVRDFYKGKPLPEDEFFTNTLVREFKIPRERVDKFIEVFTSNIQYLKAYKAFPDKQDMASIATSIDSEEIGAGQEHEAAGRTHLDNCFVMMPFGGFYDIYYKEIYMPAIKDAGFEPVRADDLFSTGMFIEQIWEQVRKAKVLLAELTGKNANVYYELGLSHAIQKPVVFVSGTIDDVPSDLRHLRVITYEVRQPNWAIELRKQITSYLKNAKQDPEKSIPATFRKGLQYNDDDSDESS
ncbi:MAG: hypothetical protein SFY68_09160 [Candidatus Sumerlaeia bacterium]|nr:hypothetical protein [Candidatus Sumerlaeia bacterium]